LTYLWKTERFQLNSFYVKKQISYSGTGRIRTIRFLIRVCFEILFGKRLKKEAKIIKTKFHVGKPERIAG
jgi:hypothetical protein